MDFRSLIVIAIALAMDASAVALSIGINCGVKKSNKLLFALSFGFFQFLFSFLGAVAGLLFQTYVATIPNIVGGIIIAFVGVLMIKEGMEQKDECFLIKPKMYLILGISVSIDALVVGFTAFHEIKSFLAIFSNALVIGLVTLILSIAAFLLSRYARKISIISKYADYIGGIILFIFGLKMIFS